MSDLHWLLSGLTHKDPTVRAKAREALLRRLDLAAVALGASELLSHPEPDIRVEIANLLESLGPVAAMALPNILALVEDADPKVRLAGCHVLASLGEGAAPDDVIEALMRAAHDQVYEVRKAAAMGLYRYGVAVVVEREEGDDDGSGAGSRERLRTVTHPSMVFKPVPEWILELASRLDAHVTTRGDAYLLTMPINEYRHQRVRLSIDAAGGTLTISTECGPLNPEEYRWALLENLKLKTGHLALREETKPGRQDELVLLTMVPLDQAFPAQLAELVREIAARGDQYEQLMTGRDDK